MPETPHLALPLIAAAQAQKHVTHNEALFVIDALLHCAVLDKDLATPPASPAAGARYIVAALPTGAWAGKAGQIAAWQDGSWIFVAPRAGFLAFVLDESLLYFHDGAAWTSVAAALSAIQNLALLGIGTTADATNPFAAKLNKALWTARTSAEGGTGDLRYTLNKEGAGNVLSFLFQTGFSGRAEFGLIGSDGPSLRVSSDGSAWRDAFRVDGATGGVDITVAEATLAAAATCDLGSVPQVRIAITGTSAISSFGTKPNAIRFLRFTGAPPLIHHATALVLPGGADIGTAAGDTLIAVSDAAGNWRVTSYQRASGAPLGQPPAPAADNTVNLGSSSRRYANIYANRFYADANAYFGISGVVVAYFFDTTANGSSYLQFNRSTLSLSLVVENANAYLWTSTASYPGADNAKSLGLPAARWSQLYATTGTINTSDARDKTAVEPLTAAEIAAASDLAREVGAFRFLDSVLRKGDAARRHVGLTVQRAMDVMAAHGLVPSRYGFICRDEWPGQEAGETAGERYGFRPDQLALFIARGQEARLAAIEARLAT